MAVPSFYSRRWNRQSSKNGQAVTPSGTSTLRSEDSVQWASWLHILLTCFERGCKDRSYCSTRNRSAAFATTRSSFGISTTKRTGSKGFTKGFPWTCLRPPFPWPRYGQSKTTSIEFLIKAMIFDFVCTLKTSISLNLVATDRTIRLHFSPSLNAGLVEHVHVRTLQDYHLLSLAESHKTNRTVAALQHYLRCHSRCFRHRHLLLSFTKAGVDEGHNEKQRDECNQE